MSQENNESGISKHDHVLVGLVVSLQAAAYQQLGKVANPLTNQVDRDLIQARATIDILEMLKVKCREGTDDEVLRLLDQAVMNLQMNYLDEMRRDQSPEAGNSDSEETEPAAEDDPAAADPAGTADAEQPEVEEK